MKRQIVTFLMVLALAMGTALWAQTTGTPQAAPPSQQVDQSGQPETGTGPDVDVDVGRNAEDGVVDVDVTRTTDPDTAAQGNDPNPGTTTGTYSNTGVDADNDNLPETASNGPLFALLGLLSLAGAFAVRMTR
jgi:LPXTG-motif cell wall-anchored protein